MKRLLFTLLACLIFIAAPVVAQEDFTEVFSLNGITVRYPAGWVATSGDTGALVLSSAAIDEPTVLTTEPGILKINIQDPMNSQQPGSILPLPDGDEALFAAAYYAGALWASNTILISLATFGSGPEVTSEMIRIEPITMAGRDGYLIENKIMGSTTVFNVIIAVEGPLLMILSGDEIAMKEYRNIAMDILDTVIVS